MGSLEFKQRLATLIPQMVLHLICFHGVLALNAKLPALVARRVPRRRGGTQWPSSSAMSTVEQAQRG